MNASRQTRSSPIVLTSTGMGGRASSSLRVHCMHTWPVQSTHVGRRQYLHRIKVALECSAWGALIRFSPCLKKGLRTHNYVRMRNRTAAPVSDKDVRFKPEFFSFSPAS